MHEIFNLHQWADKFEALRADTEKRVIGPLTFEQCL